MENSNTDRTGPATGPSTDRDVDSIDSILSVDSILSIECGTCVATGTTACADCVVSHLLANDDGPIEFVTVAPPRSTVDRAIALFAGAGLLDDPVHFVTIDEFERGQAVAVDARGG